MKCKMFGILSDIDYRTDDIINEWLEVSGPITIKYVTSSESYIFVFYKEKEEDV